MSFSAKPDDPRPSRGRSLPDAAPAAGRAQQPRASRRNATGDHTAQAPEAACAGAGARIIVLSWADTFGRPARAWPRGMTGRVLPFRVS